MPYRNEDHDRLDPAEYPDPDDDEGLMPCPACGHLIFDESVRCPVCETYVGEQQGKSAWVVAGILVCLAISIGWVILG